MVIRCMVIQWQPAISDADVTNDKWGCPVPSVRSPLAFIVSLVLQAKFTPKVLPHQWNLEQFSLSCTIAFTTFESNFLLIKTSFFWKQVKIVITTDIKAKSHLAILLEVLGKSLGFGIRQTSNPFSPQFTRFVTLVNSLTSLMVFIYRREITNLTGLISGVNKITYGKSGMS